MRKDLAIEIESLSKTYFLYGSQRDQLIDVIGLSNIGIRPKVKPREFVALKDINLEVAKGQRIGIVGRNGAGKSTLLKLICGNFAPTEGSVAVNGQIQALMSVGIGFHPEYTGRENVESSLKYNGLLPIEHQRAIADIIEFCELGEFFDQPFKTYSQGMQSRLMFAVATCVKPDILIIDEVLGAGDAYFIAKSKIRVEQLVNSGCTMLLVSHSMQQIMELCEKAIWIDDGEIRMFGDSSKVVKAYEENLHGPIADLDSGDRQSASDLRDLKRARGSDLSLSVGNFQEPYFIPHKLEPSFTNMDFGGSSAEESNAVSKTGLSRWGTPDKLKVENFEIFGPEGATQKLISFQAAKFRFSLGILASGEYSLRYGIVVHDIEGREILKIFSPNDTFLAEVDDIKYCEVLFNPLQLGEGTYTVGISVHDYGSLTDLNSIHRYDLLSRSFEFTVSVPEFLGSIKAQFFHSVEWGL